MILGVLSAIVLYLKAIVNHQRVNRDLSGAFRGRGSVYCYLILCGFIVSNSTRLFWKNRYDEF